MPKGRPIDLGAVGFAGTTVQCDAESTSFYCQTVKLFNLIVIFGFVAFIVYFLLTKLRK
jgi:hypothetical protein